VLDPQNSIVESDEEDNSAQATLALATANLPNLALSTSNVSFDPEDPLMGDDVTVIATILNDGVEPAQNVTVQFVDVTNGATPIGEPQVVDLIPVGGSGVVQVTYSTRGLAGDRQIEITVDPYNFIAETRETDNEVRATLSVTPPPTANLTVAADNIGFSPAAATAGDVVTVAAVVLNTGDAPAEGVIVQFLDVSGGTILPIGERQTIDYIAPGGSALAQVAYPTEELTGQRRIQVVVDPNNFVPETNETDNEATAGVTLAALPAPNLTVAAANIVFATPRPTAGNEVTITAVIVNNGAAEAERVLVQFVDVTNGGFVPIGTEQTIPLIPPGASATASTVFSTTGLEGSRKIQVLVDSNNLIAETDENDNEAVATLPITGEPLANLTVSAAGIGFSPAQPSAGDVVTVTVTVHNQGTARADNVVVQLLDMSEGEPVPVGQAQNVGSIPAGSAVVVAFTYGGEELDDGERLLRVVVDPSNFVKETDETDNRASATLTVAPAELPNLTVLPVNVGFLPPEPSDGQIVTLTVTILNTGSRTATDVLVQFVDVTGGAADPIGAKQTIAAIPPGGSASVQVPYDTRDKVGERRIRVVVDPHSTVLETAENDNEAVTVLRVAARPLPNLTARPENIGLAVAAPAPGQPVTVTATILNTGAADAHNVVVQFVDATDSPPTPIAASQVISTIPAGGAAATSIVYDTRGRFGSRKVQVIVDPNNLIVERDENDNRAAGTLDLQSPPIANLVLRSTAIGFDPAEAGLEGTVIVYATVMNDGDAGVGEVIVQFLDTTDGGSTPIGEMQTLPAIGPGASGLVQATYVVPSGTGDRKVQVVVDPNNTIIEASESDNQTTATLKRSKAALANLSLTTDNVTFTPADPIEGDTVTIHAVILNNGAANAQDVVVQLTDTTGGGSVPVGPQQIIPSLPAGSSAIVEVTYDTTGKAGSRSIRVAVDPNNFIPESSDTDNTATVSLDINTPGRPNLVVTGGNVNFSPLAPTAGQDVTIRAVILNHGALEARDVVVQFVDTTNGAQSPIGTPQTIARIPPGAAATAQVTYATDGLLGERSIQVVADPNNFIVESREDDNRVDKALVVGAPPAPNLVMLSSNVEFTPPEPQDGNLVTIQANVLNNGAAGATDVVVRFDDVTNGAPELIGKQRLIDALAPGEDATVQVTFDTTDKAGERRIQITVDPMNTIMESDEQDNSAIIPLTIAPPPAPNLVVREDGVRFTPVAPTDGQAVTITVTVLNEGQRNASRVEVQVLDATNSTPVPVGDVQVIGGISAGSSGIAQFVYDTTGKEGERLLRVEVDPASLIPETDETDNSVEATLTVAPPSTEPDEQPNLSLTSSSVVYTPTAPMPGDMVTLTVEVANTGEGIAYGAVVVVTDTTDSGNEPVGEPITIPMIAAGDVYTVEFTYDTTDKSGSRTLTVAADPDNAIEESNEFDNRTTVTIPLGGEPGEPGEPPAEGEPPADEPPAEEQPTSRAETQAAGELNVEMADDVIRRANDPSITP
jgi:subtilase family serine protease